MKKIAIIGLLAFVSGLSWACGKDDETPAGGGSAELPKLAIDNLRQAPVKMGAAVSVPTLKSDEQYRELVKKEYSSLTPENAMKMSALSTGIDNYSWTDADYLVDFAQANGMRVHGHTLVWYRTIPAWFESYSGTTTAQWEALLRNYITAVVTHFKGKVASWDVVNEAVADDGTLRPCLWKTRLGARYIELAFQYAHAADPDAILFYNDYGQEYNHAKHVAINTMLDTMINKGIPIHGVGLQMHTDVAKSEQRIRYAIRAAAAHGGYVHVSELDVSVNPDDDTDATFTAELAKKQQDVYRWVAQGMMEVPAAQRFGITMWGVTDQYSWRYPAPDWVLPFDAQYARKAAYDGFLQGFYQ